MKEPKTILVVDDEEDVRKSVGRLLLNKGYEVCMARDGEDALNKALDLDEPDLVILDVMMPVLNGYEVLVRLRKKYHFNAPVIMLTAKGGDMDIVDGYLKGADFYLTKPFEPQTLLDAVSFYIGDLPAEEREKLDRKLWERV